MPLLDHFNWIAPFYDRLMRSNHQEHWLRLLDVQPGSLLLDAGGGTGRASALLGCVSCTVVVVDVSAGMLRQAAAKPALHAVQAEAEALPFQDASFDRILMVDALHHVADQERTIAQLWRALKPGGRLLVEEPEIRRVQTKLIALAEKLMWMRSHFLSAQQIEEMLLACGASVRVEMVGINALILAEKEPAAVDS